MRLRYDHYTGRYLGERYSVSEGAFLAALQALIIAGREPEDALDSLLEESSWSQGVDGVTLLPRQPACRHCGTRLPPLHQSFCNVVCEAAFIAVVAAVAGGQRQRPQR